MNLRNLFQNTRHAQEFPAGTTIFEKGAPGDFMYVILDGELEVWAGNELTEVLGPGQIVGEMALIDSEPRSATVVAKSNCRLALIDEKRFLFMVDETPTFALQVMRIIVKRLRLRNDNLKTGSL
jgi:CRP/FNR family cyclic AMP-dependent transcriptional regulator